MRLLSSVLQEARLFAQFSAQRVLLRRERATTECELQGEDTPACWRTGGKQDEWCASCKAREAAHQAFVRVSRLRTAAMRRLLDRVRRCEEDGQ